MGGAFMGRPLILEAGVPFLSRRVWVFRFLKCIAYGVEHPLQNSMYHDLSDRF
jgi:hypothetical protein